MDELYEGEVRKGTVSSLCNFGAFVDLGGADGLVHISELAWHRVKHPREVLSVGDDVEVYVLRLDHDRGRIGLSLKRLQPDPWTLVDEKYHVGQVVKGTVTNVVAFGAFARLEPGVEGLIHVSELAEGKVDHPSSVVKKGDELTLRVISINARRRRIGLSLRQAPPPEELAEEEEEPAPQAEPAPEEVEPEVEEPAVSEEEAETAAEVEEQEEEAPEVEEAPEPELDSEEDEPAVVEEPAAPEEEQAEAGLEIEEEEEGLAEVEEEPQPEPAPEGEVVPDEVEETGEEPVVSEEGAEIEEDDEEESEEAPQVEAVEETS
jgi:small subunit ribosomal protein S1